MPDNFQLFRLSLVERSQDDMFPEPNVTDRESYLRYIFTTKWEYDHRGSTFHFIPAPHLSASDGLMGKFGRAVTVEENTSPDQGFEDVLRPGWKAAVLVIDPVNHADGQKVAVQHDPKVGSPGAILDSFIDFIARRHPSAPFVIKAEPIFNADTFWEFAAENRGEITTVTFEFVVPNGLWNAETDLKDELREARELVKAQKVVATFKSQDGLETDSPQIKEAVDYVEKGSGEVTAKSKRGKRFSSKNKPKRTILHDNPDDPEPLIVRAARQIAKVLGK
ncbi:hypothetical protein [Asticcacaulis sp.]|uniref:hypothetical protein n=1 Tax=Asticcacaulis sp. TaxID=1872648 RepID=UPI0031DEC47A